MKKCLSYLLIFTLFIFLISCGGADSEETPDYFVISGNGGVSGNNQSFTKGTLVFNMKYVAGGTFPTGTDDLAGNKTISTSYWIGETEITYELWNTVYTWAIAHGYTFSHSGVKGDGSGDTDKHPVTNINWRDTIVWCNALTEYYNANNGSDSDLDCVYYTDYNYTTPIRTSTDSTTITETTAGSEDYPYIKASLNSNKDMANCTSKGFRLPTSAEWECSARYEDGTDWTIGSYVSGSTAIHTNFSATDSFAWFGNSLVSGTGNTTSTQSVATQLDNSLGIFDMSGNVWELCFDW